MGENSKHVTVLVADNKSTYLEDKHLQFLISILSACKLNLADVALVNTKNITTPFSEIKSQLVPQQMIFFGLPTAITDLPFTIPEYQVQQYNGCSYLFAPELKVLNGNSAVAKEQKTKLWMSLKKMFNV